MQTNLPYPTFRNPPRILDIQQNMQTALTLFMEDSYFNADLSVGKCASYESDVRQLWGKLDGKKRFPLSELVPLQRNLSWLL